MVLRWKLFHLYSEENWHKLWWGWRRLVELVHSILLAWHGFVDFESARLIISISPLAFNKQVASIIKQTSIEFQSISVKVTLSISQVVCVPVISSFDNEGAFVVLAKPKYSRLVDKNFSFHWKGSSLESKATFPLFDLVPKLKIVTFLTHLPSA